KAAPTRSASPNSERKATAMKRIVGILCLVVAASSSDVAARAAPPASELGPCEREMLRASKQHRVPISVLYAVGLTESARRRVLQPFALNIDGASVFAQSADEALQTFRSAKARGARFID